MADEGVMAIFNAMCGNGETSPIAVLNLTFSSELQVASKYQEGRGCFSADRGVGVAFRLTKGRGCFSVDKG